MGAPGDLGGRGYPREYDSHAGSFWASTRTRVRSSRPGRAAPGACHLLTSNFFNDALEMSICPRKVRRQDSGVGPWRRPNPWRNRTFLQTCPLLGEGLSGDQSQRGKRESPRKGAYRANPGGVRAGGRGQRDGSPRKPMGPGKFQPPCASLGQFLRLFSYRGQASMPTTRNRGSGRSPAADFSEDASEMSESPG